MVLIGHIAHYGRTEILNFTSDEFLEIHRICENLAEKIYRFPCRL